MSAVYEDFYIYSRSFQMDNAVCIGSELNTSRTDFIVLGFDRTDQRVFLLSKLLTSIGTVGVTSEFELYIHIAQFAADLEVYSAVFGLADDGSTSAYFAGVATGGFGNSLG